MKIILSLFLVFGFNQVSACEVSEQSASAFVFSLSLGRPVAIQDQASACYYLGVLRNPLRYLEGATRKELSSDASCAGKIPDELTDLSAEAYSNYLAAAGFCGSVVFPPQSNQLPKGDWSKLSQAYGQLHEQIVRIRELAQDITP